VESETRRRAVRIFRGEVAAAARRGIVPRESPLMLPSSRSLSLAPHARRRLVFVRNANAGGNKMSERRCFRFAYTMPCHKDREPHPFQLRDGEAAAMLIAELAGHGYRYVGPLPQYPAPGPDLIPYDDSFMRETDVLLITTRLPMHDIHVPDRRRIHRSYTQLEDKIFKALHVWFLRCARSEIELTDQAAAVSQEIGKRQSIAFHQNAGAEYMEYGSPVTGEWRRFRRVHTLTAAFLVYVAHPWPGGPALLAAFGMGGKETLGWCYQLANRFRHLLFTTPFAMAELQTGPLTERPTSIHFADSWDVTLLGVAPPTPARGPQAA
jgi:hypothetical protein